MAKQKLTSRQTQANRTRQKIYKVAVGLMEKKGFNNVTIEEISKKAGVSVGAFYHYYKSKDDIFFEIYKRADKYFEDEVTRHVEKDDLNAFDKIVLFFKYYARYNKEWGLENVSQLYNSKNKFFTTKDRYMITLLTSIIAKGQENGEISTEMTAESITEYLFIAARGIIVDWCIYDGGYDLEKMAEQYIRRLIPIFKP